jgi:hypothetical protein
VRIRIFSKCTPSHGHDGTIVNGISCIGFMTGGRAALWRDEEMAQTFAARAATFVEEQKDRRFFLYFAPHDPHVPRAPNQRFVGDPSMGPRGDAIVQADWAVGEIVRTLDRLRLIDNTNRETNTELGNDTEPQLYDLAADPGERTNVAEKFPAKANELHRLLDGLRAAGRSR